MAPSGNSERNRETRDTETDEHDCASAHRKIRLIGDIVNDLSESVHGNGVPGKFEESMQFRLSRIIDELKRQREDRERQRRWWYGVLATVAVMLIRTVYQMILENAKK